MIGLPTETPQDQESIVDLSERVSNTRREVEKGPGRVNVSIAIFVPKPHTPFQWEPMVPRKDAAEARRRILDKAGMRCVRYRFHDDRTSLMEGVIARGDRRLGRAILRAWRNGARFDAWSEHFEFDRWMEALEEEGLDAAFYAHRERAEDEILPWDHIDFGVSREFLLKEREKARREEFTDDCRWNPCPWCGACAEPGAQRPAGTT
jgi:radical SAM superfamily enzyme YgiQ (UPF0313 family)